MNTRKKITFAGALGLSAAAIGGGASVTSHAMADGTVPPKGSLVVIAMQAGDTQPVKCTYDDIDLPTAAPTVAAGSDTGPKLVTGAVGAGGPLGPVTQGGSEAGVITVTGSATAGGDGPSLQTAGSLPDGSAPLPPLVISSLDDANVRAGTAEECAALRPGTVGPGLPGAPEAGTAVTSATAAGTAP